MTDKPKEKDAPNKYRVLCWGACTDDSPCSFSYVGAGGKRREAKTGDIVDDLPVSEIGKHGQEAYRNLILGVHIEAVT